VAKIDYDKLGIKDCRYCGKPFKRGGPNDSACPTCKKATVNVSQQVARDIQRYRKFGTYDTIGRGGNQVNSRSPPVLSLSLDPRQVRSRRQVQYDIDTQAKYCTTCGELKTFEEFRKRKGSNDGRENRCRLCQSLEERLKRGDDYNSYKNRVKKLKDTYNLSEDSFVAMCDKQKGCCEICGHLM